MAAEDDDKLFDDIVERELFIDLVSHGTPPNMAGIEVGWTPRKTAANMADPEFAELIEYAKLHRDDRVEKALYDCAIEKHNMVAIQIILFNRRAAEFRDVKKIEIRTESTVRIDVVNSTKTALLEMIRQHPGDTIAALQAGDDDDDIVDAEVVDDDDLEG